MVEMKNLHMHLCVWNEIRAEVAAEHNMKDLDIYDARDQSQAMVLVRIVKAGDKGGGGQTAGSRLQRI